MEADTFDEGEFFNVIANSGARALLIGRRAMLALGFPVHTADYDYWLHIDDIEIFNRCLAALDMVPTHGPSEARARGRYVVENGEHVDVMVAREIRSGGNMNLAFESLWERRQIVVVHGTDVPVPSIEDLRAMKRIASRPKDIEDVRMLDAFAKRGGQ